MTSMVADAALSNTIRIDSAGTHCGRVGEGAYFRVVDTLERYGVPTISAARQLEFEDLSAFDYIFAMDRRNLSFILRHSAGSPAKVSLFLENAQRTGFADRDEVTDPFPDGDYEATYKVITAGCAALMVSLRYIHGL